jgi:uncharacterized repeat protein (TIGR01451 family)
MKKTFLILISCLCLAACDKYEFLNLKRDNPLDGKNDAEMKNGVNLKLDTFSVYSDNNGDKIINNGETVRLRVWLKNTGTSTANSVKATFSTTSTYVSDFKPTTQLNYGNLATEESVWSYNTSISSNYTIQFTVSLSTPAGTQIPVNISITDESGNVWTDSFTVTVEAT